MIRNTFKYNPATVGIAMSKIAAVLPWLGINGDVDCDDGGNIVIKNIRVNWNEAAEDEEVEEFV